MPNYRRNKDRVAPSGLEKEEFLNNLTHQRILQPKYVVNSRALDVKGLDIKGAQACRPPYFCIGTDGLCENAAFVR